MDKWKISEAKAQFTKLLTFSKNAPQIICNRDKPVSVVMNIKLFEELIKLRDASVHRPTIAEMLSEMESIKKLEPGGITIPKRMNRTNPFEESTDEMDL